MAASLSNLQTAANARHAPRARPLILVTDDDEDTRFLFRTVLLMRGYNVIEATDGEEAVRLAETVGPDLILMDGSLPRLDGLEATRRIRKLAHVGHVPVIFISGRAEPAFRSVALEAGCDEYLVKPFELGQLGSMLEKHLASASVESRAARGPS